MTDDVGGDRVWRERRWQPAGAVLVLVMLPVLLPDRLRLGPAWALPVLGGLFLIAFLVTDPSEFGRRSRVVRVLAIGLTAAFILGAGWLTVRLSRELLLGGPTTESAAALLATGALVWVNNNIVFGFLYWELDSGGPAARAHSSRPYPDFAFPQHLTSSPPGRKGIPSAAPLRKAVDAAQQGSTVTYTPVGNRGACPSRPVEHVHYRWSSLAIARPHRTLADVLIFLSVASFPPATESGGFQEGS